MVGIFWFKLISAGLAVIFVLSPGLVLAQTLDQAQNEYNGQNAQSQSLQNQVNQQQRQADTLQAQLDAMTAQVNAIQSKIDDTNGKIADVNVRLAVIESRLAAKKVVLDDYIKNNYQVSQTTPLEMLVGSNSLSEFMDQKQYSDTAQAKIQKLVEEVMVVKREVDKEKAALDKLNADLAGQKATMDSQVAAKNDLLAKTKGDQAAYQAMLDKSNAARDRLAQTIAKLMGSGPMRSQGYVQQGQVIGHQGNTGFSTGTHLHFGAYVNKAAVNPHQYLNSGKFMWPESSFTIGQEYGPAAWVNSHYTFHDGIDMDGTYGEPVQAAAAGNIVINGWQPDGFGHYIVIDHGNGLWSLYGHMQQ